MVDFHKIFGNSADNAQLFEQMIFSSSITMGLPLRFPREMCHFNLSLADINLSAAMVNYRTKTSFLNKM